VKALHLCDEEMKKKIIAWQEMAPEELDALIKEKEDQIAAAEAAFKEAVEKLQNRHRELDVEREKTIEAVKNGGLTLVKQVKGYLYPYEMSSLEKFYYTVMAPVENLMQQLGLLDSVQNFAKGIQGAVSIGTSSLSKAFGVEL
jgi:hypothetical protein